MDNTYSNNMNNTNGNNANPQEPFNPFTSNSSSNTGNNGNMANQGFNHINSNSGVVNPMPQQPQQNDYTQSPYMETPATTTVQQQSPQQDYSQMPQSQQVQPEPTDTNVEAETDYPQDERIVNYLLTEVIPARYPQMPADQLVSEKDRLYKILESGIFDTAYKQLQEDQKNELDTLMKYGANIPAIQAFFIEKIPDIQVQLGKYMEEFVQTYLKGEI